MSDSNTSASRSKRINLAALELRTNDLEQVCGGGSDEGDIQGSGGGADDRGDESDSDNTSSDLWRMLD